MGQSILFRANFGIPGDISRAGAATVEGQALNPAAPFASYGIPGKIVNGQFVPLTVVGDVTPYGILVRPYPTNSSQDPIGTSTPPTSGVAGILRRGYISAACNGGVAALNAPVYVRYANPVAGAPIGGLEALSVAGTNVALTNAFWMGPQDAAGNAEIGFNI
jgi:hypothetical protein